MGNWKNWINGLIGAFIGAAATAVSVLIIDPEKFSPSEVGGWAHLGLALAISGGVGAASYLKQHPTPFDATTVATSITTQPGTTPKTTTTVEQTHIEPKP